MTKVLSLVIILLFNTWPQPGPYYPPIQNDPKIEAQVMESLSKMRDTRYMTLIEIKKWKSSPHR